MSDKKEIRKSKEIISMIPKIALSKVEDYLYHVTLFKFGKNFWDFENNCLIKQDKYEFEFNAQDVTNLLGIDKSNLSREMVSSFDNISALAFKVDSGRYKRFIPVFHEIGYDTLEHKVRVRFNDVFVKHVIDVKKDFVKISLAQVMSFKSKYTRPIYDLIKSKASSDNKINCNIKIEEIRKHLHIENKYKAFTDFRKRVLLPIMKDLETSDLKIVMNKLISIRKVYALNFKGVVVEPKDKKLENQDEFDFIGM